jgi:hypothetical protein
MERYLSSPQQEEVASPEAIEANIEAAENEKPISTQEFTWESGFNAMQDIDDTSRDTIDKKVLPPLQRQRRRASLTRAKDDCLTCKRLYKECDRQRTDCSQCIKIGKECSGYYPESTGVSLPVSASTPIDTAIPKYTPPISPFCGVLRLAGFTDDNPPIIPSPSTWDAESSAGSIGSDASYGSMDSRGSRRGRRRWKNPYPSKPKASEARSPKVEYHCTFPGCGKSFIYRSEWDRHESSIHYPQDVWICCNTMDIFSFLEMSIQPEEANVGNPQVLESQNLRQIFSQCIVKNETNRSFYRKDQFIQHLRQCHLKQSSAIKENEARRLWEILTATWMRKVTYASWEAAGLHCSLCDVSFDTWAGRKQHFARHFMDGVFIWNDEQTAQKMGSIFSPKLLLDKPYR